MTFTIELGLDVIQVNMLTNFQVPTSNDSAVRVLNNRRRHIQTHRTTDGTDSITSTAAAEGKSEHEIKYLLAISKQLWNVHHLDLQ